MLFHQANHLPENRYGIPTCLHSEAVLLVALLKACKHISTSVNLGVVEYGCSFESASHQAMSGWNHARMHPVEAVSTGRIIVKAFIGDRDIILAIRSCRCAPIFPRRVQDIRRQGFRDISRRQRSKAGLAIGLVCEETELRFPPITPCCACLRQAPRSRVTRFLRICTPGV